MLSCVQEGHTQVIIRTVDTDIVLLAISVVSTLHSYGMEELWISFGTGKHFRIFVHLIVFYREKTFMEV